MSEQRGNGSAFRRRRFEAPHRRRRLAVRLLRPLLTAVLGFGLPAAALVWLLTSPRLGVLQLSVRGAGERVAADWVCAALEPLRGRHLLWIELPEVATLLADHPWIRSAAIRKELPDRLVVTIEQRRPAALLERDDGLYYVERDGRVIAPLEEAAEETGLVRIRAERGGPDAIASAIEVAASWRELRPAGAELPLRIEVLNEDDYRVAAGLPFELLVSRHNLEPGLGRLNDFLPEIRRRYPSLSALDLRFTNQYVIPIAAQPLTQEG